MHLLIVAVVETHRSRTAGAPAETRHDLTYRSE